MTSSPLINSLSAFARDIKVTQVIHNLHGKQEVTVVNIQNFRDEPDVVSTKDYDVSIQRIYFLDEVHRSYNPKGSFLANLSQSDTQAIKVVFYRIILVVGGVRPVAYF